MVSKKLVTEILGISLNDSDITIIDEDIIVSSNGIIFKTITIYKFQHECKEWLVNTCHQCVWSGNGYLKQDGYHCTIASFYGGDETVFRANTELEAVFMACEDILKDEK